MRTQRAGGCWFEAAQLLSPLFSRFRHGYCKGNPRKMVRTWAEKEMRNLIRSEPAGPTSRNPDQHLNVCVCVFVFVC